MAYRKGKLIGCVVFDGMGRDYIASPPFSAEEEEAAVSGMLLLLNTGRPYSLQQ